MNALELADELEERYLQGCIYQEAATMLRQQQSEIEALKADNDKLKEALNRANRVYDFDNPLLDKAQEQ